MKYRRLVSFFNGWHILIALKGTVSKLEKIVSFMRL